MAASMRNFIADVRKVQRRLKLLRIFPAFMIGFLYFSGAYQYLLASSYDVYYEHPGSQEDFSSLLSAYQSGKPLKATPTHSFEYKYIHSPLQKCETRENVRILFVVKSTIDNIDRRKAIRGTWGKEDRFTDVQIRTVFLLGVHANGSHYQQLKVNQEVRTHHDIVQADFQEDYYNLTLKSTMGLDWAMKYCENVQYFAYVDDDYYISTKNMLRFIKNPLNYPEYLTLSVPASKGPVENLYAGTVFLRPIPIRWTWSKWYVSLSEYPYSYYPPYITGGATIVSRASLVKLYVAMLFTKPFRLDDVFVGMVAKKAGLSMINSPHMHFHELPYSSHGYQHVIASHGFGDPQRLKEVWTEQRSYGVV